MRCKNAQDILISGGADERVREHLQVCPVCQGFARDYENLQEGWHALTARPAPEPSWGFAQRVLRRLEELPTGAGRTRTSSSAWAGGSCMRRAFWR